MSDAIKKLHDYLAKSPSVVYPEDVLAYLPAIEDENAKLREQIASFIELSQDMVIYAGQNMKRHFAKRLRKLGVPL